MGVCKWGGWGGDGPGDSKPTLNKGTTTSSTSSRFIKVITFLGEIEGEVRTK